MLLLQGLFVRRFTPKLPEPDGPRHGHGGCGRRELHLLILGDSAAAGVGAPAQTQALSGQLLEQLHSDFSIHWRLLATSGHRARDTLADLRAAPAETFDIAAISIGVNDVTAGARIRNWLQDIDRLIEQLQQAHRVRRIIFSGLPPMHRFPALPQPLRWVLGERARQFNLALSTHLSKRPGCDYMPPEYPPHPEQVASDGFHPGPLAYRHWAGIFARQIRALETPTNPA